MLSVKKTSIDKKKIVIYASLIIVLVAFLIYQLSSNIFGETPANIQLAENVDLLGTAVSGGAGGKASGDFTDISTTSPDIIMLLKKGLFKDIVDNPKYKILKEQENLSYKELEKGKANPFLPD